MLLFFSTNIVPLLIGIVVGALVGKHLIAWAYAAYLERQVETQKEQGNDAHKAAAIKMMITIISKTLFFSDDTVTLKLAAHIRQFKPKPDIISDPQYKELITAILRRRPELFEEWVMLSLQE